MPPSAESIASTPAFIENKELKSPTSPLPPVLEFPSTSSSVPLINALKLSSRVIVRNLLTLSELSQIESDVRPWLDKDKPWDGTFFPPETRRAVGLLGKSKTFAVKIVGNGLWLEVVDALLTSEMKVNWVGDKIESSVGKPQLNNTVVFSIGPGARDQALHR